MRSCKKMLMIVMIIFAYSNAFSIVDTSIIKEAHIWVRNNSATSITLLVERTENIIPDSSQNYFCWGSCYPPFVSISTETVTIPAFNTDKISFIGDYEIKGGAALSDTSRITYCFIDDCNAGNTQCFTAFYSLDGPADSLYQMIAFDTSWCTFASTEEISQIARPLINIHPNPAKDILNLKYSLNNRDGEDGYFILRNMLGVKVIKVNLNASSDKLTIPILGLNRGVYFYSLVVNKKVYSTNKLIIDN